MPDSRFSQEDDSEPIAKDAKERRKKNFPTSKSTTESPGTRREKPQMSADQRG